MVDVSALEIKSSSWEAEWPRLPSLLVHHGHELGEAHIVLDLVSIAEMDKKGALAITVAHDDEVGLVGYCIWYLGPDLSRQGALCAQMGPFYVLPEYRKQGLARDLLEISLSALAKRGVWKAFPHFYEASPNLGPMFDSLGAIPYERVWMIDLRKKA